MRICWSELLKTCVGRLQNDRWKVIPPPTRVGCHCHRPQDAASRTGEHRLQQPYFLQLTPMGRPMRRSVPWNPPSSEEASDRSSVARSILHRMLPRRTSARAPRCVDPAEAWLHAMRPSSEEEMAPGIQPPLTPKGEEWYRTPRLNPRHAPSSPHTTALNGMARQNDCSQPDCSVKDTLIHRGGSWVRCPTATSTAPISRGALQWDIVGQDEVWALRQRKPSSQRHRSTSASQPSWTSPMLIHHQTNPRGNLL